MLSVPSHENTSFLIDAVRILFSLWDTGEDVTVSGMLKLFGRKRKAWTAWSKSCSQVLVVLCRDVLNVLFNASCQ